MKKIKEKTRRIIYQTGCFASTNRENVIDYRDKFLPDEPVYKLMEEYVRGGWHELDRKIIKEKTLR